MLNRPRGRSRHRLDGRSEHEPLCSELRRCMLHVTYMSRRRPLKAWDMGTEMAEGFDRTDDRALAIHDDREGVDLLDQVRSARRVSAGEMR